jgi:hypothetical protein
VEVAGLDDHVFDSFEPPHLGVGELGPGLRLFGELVGPAVFDGAGVRDEFVVVAEGEADEGDKLGGGVTCGVLDPPSVDCLVGSPKGVHGPAVWRALDALGEVTEFAVGNLGGLGLGVDGLDGAYLVSVVVEVRPPRGD